jgi:hypothetical protein
MADTLMKIRDGMKVIDSTGEEIGTVEWVHLSDEDPDTPQAETVTGDLTDDRNRQSFVHLIADAFSTDNLPEELRERLMRNGFIRIDATGLFAADRYVLPEQIQAVSGDRVTLNVPRDDLIKR